MPHDLEHSWTFWYTHRPAGTKASAVDYANQMKKIADISTAEDFWSVYQWLKRPLEMPVVTDFMMFKQGIQAIWEDDHNINGGKWIVRLKIAVSDRVWENLIVGIVSGHALDDEMSEDICGVVLSLRQHETIVAVWNKDCQSQQKKEKLSDAIKSILELPEATVMEYKNHQSALKDKSSFQNTDAFR